MHSKGSKKAKNPVKKFRENDSIVEKSMLYQIGDVVIQLPANHMLPFYQQHHKNYDKFLPHLVKFFNDGSVVVDVGANCGDTLAAMVNSNKNLRYICIEPDNEFYNYLEINASLIRKKFPELKIDIVQRLVSNLDIVSGLSGSGGTKQRDSIIGNNTNTVYESAPLVDILNASGAGTNLRLIKSDVDGYDYEVILSAGNWLKDHDLMLYFECQYMNITQRNGYIQLFKNLTEFGFTDFWFFDNFGGFILNSNDFNVQRQLIDYIWLQNQNSSTRTVYYFDILASKATDFELVQKIINQYVSGDIASILLHGEKLYSEEKSIEAMKCFTEIIKSAENDDGSEIKTNEQMDYIFKDRPNPLCDITQDKRSVFLRSPSQEKPFARISFYEFVQNLQKNNTALSLLFAPSVNPQILCDLSDLPHLRLYIRNNGSELPHESIALFHNTGIDEQVRTITEEEIKNTMGVWDAVVMTTSDLAIDTLENFLISVNFSLLIISDEFTPIESEKRQNLTNFLKITGFEAINDNPLVYHWKNKTACGEYFFSKNQVIGSLRCFERALIDNPANEDALNNLGVISHNFKRYQEAENFFNRAIRINNRNKNTLDNLIQNYIATEKFEDAAKMLKERISMEPEQPELYSLLGLCHERLNHTNEAHDAYQKAKELGGATTLIPIPEPVVVSDPVETLKKNGTIIIDGVFFQMYRTGIARVWKSLLTQWAKTPFGQKLLVLDRNGTSPRLDGLRYRQIGAYDYNNTDADRAMLQKVCEEENASIFISTYYTTPLITPSVFMGYDMIPEIAGWDTNIPMWREKHYGIRHAAHYIVISQNTANDLRRFFPDIAPSKITVAHTGVDFSRPSKDAVKAFKNQFGISKPYWLLVGGRGGYKNGILFFKAFERLGALRKDYAIVCTGPTGVLEAEYAACIGKADVFTLDLSDDDLQVAYAGAIALVYPSLYEGFGMPIIEAMACGCPVITSPSGSIPEVAGNAALLVNPGSVDEMLSAMKKVQKPKLRHSLMNMGIQRSQLYSWKKMADEVKNVLLQVAAEK